MFAFILLSSSTRGFSVTMERKASSFTVKERCLILASLKTFTASHQLSFSNLSGLFQLCSDAYTSLLHLAELALSTPDGPPNIQELFILLGLGWEKVFSCSIILTWDQQSEWNFATPFQRQLSHSCHDSAINVLFLHLPSHLANKSVFLNKSGIVYSIVTRKGQLQNKTAFFVW